MSVLSCRVFKKIFQQGRSEREGETYLFRYVEPLSDARTKLEGFFNSLPGFSLNCLQGIATMRAFVHQ